MFALTLHPWRGSSALRTSSPGPGGPTTLDRLVTNRSPHRPPASGARIVLLTTLVLLAHTAVRVRADEFTSFVRPLLVDRCTSCHSGEQAKGEINLAMLETADQLIAQPRWLQRLITVLDAGDMPPSDAPALTEAARTRLLGALKELRGKAAASEVARLPLHRLNRYQYNYAVRDLFQLQCDVFPLPEKLLTRLDSYLPLKTGRMPDVVQATSHTLQPVPGLRDVRAFPKDLRAEHGFDNQATQLTLSPLLLDAYLRLAVSIVESPDFRPPTVGIWPELFADPAADLELSAELPRRLRPFLRRAFRGPVDDATVQRYADYALAQRQQLGSFPAAMKKVAAAVLCSPRFLYRAESEPDDGPARQFALASRLSFFLWSSGPDDELLAAAERGELRDPVQLRRTLDRLLADPKIERFLDAFPTQWLQLENILAATPDPQQSRYFRLEESRPASLQMLVEPLLLFDAVFLENRPLVDLIAPDFSYRSDFLRDWYESPLQPPPLDLAAVRAENDRRTQLRQQWNATSAAAQRDVERLTGPVRERLREEKRRRAGGEAAVDLRPYAAWEFNGDLRDSVGALTLTPQGEVRFEDGHVILDRAYLQSAPLDRPLQAKTLEVWCRLANLDQPGGGVMTLQGPGDFFDSIVIGERQPRQWISGSNGFARTDDFAGAVAETEVDRWIHLVMVYAPDGTTTLYRNGVPYGQPFRKGAAKFPRQKSSVLFGLRHLPAGGNRYLAVRIDKARLYDRALTVEEVQASASGSGFLVTEEELLAALDDGPRVAYREAAQRLAQAQAELAQLPLPVDVEQVQRDHQRRFEDDLRTRLRGTAFRRTHLTDARYGGVVTCAAVLTMTSGPRRTQPIARGAWLIEVIFNDPPPPPPNNVPPLQETDDSQLTIRERFAAHRANPSCAGCHSRLDPLGFALENFDITGRWRERYDNGLPVDASGTLFKKHEFTGPASFKQAVLDERQRFARAFTSHLMRYALARELTAADQQAIDTIVAQAAGNDYRLRELVRAVALSERLLGELR